MTLTFGNKSLKYTSQTFPSGSKWQIVGPSGCGKSSYFRYLLSLLPEGIVQNPPPLHREYFAWIPQEYQLGHGGTWALLEEFLTLLIPLHSPQKKGLLLEKVQKTLEGWAWPQELWDQNFESLSGGEKQRLALALGLALERPWLLIDEGLTGIEPVLLKKVLQDLNESPRGLLIISHQALPFLQRQVHVAGGRP